MNVKRFVAKEWLYIAGFAIGCIALFLLNENSWKPTREDYPNIYTYEQLFDMSYEDARKTVKEVQENLPESVLDSIRNLYVYGDSTETAKERYAINENRYKAYVKMGRIKAAKAELKYRSHEEWHYIIKLSIVIAYPVFLLIRSFIWAFRQVRKKPPATN